MTDTEYNLIQRLTRATQLDQVFDIQGNENEEYWQDFEEDKQMPLKEGFELLAESIAYSFQHEGFTDAEVDILEKLIQKYVPNFSKLDPATD